MARDTNEDLIKDLVHAHQRAEKEALTKEEYEEIGDYNARQFENRFGSWTKAKIKAGVPRATPGQKKQVTKEDIAEDMRKVADGKTLKQEEYKEKGTHSLNTVYARFDKWEDALDKAGLEKSRKGTEPKITEEQLKKEVRKGKTLKEISEEYGYASLNPLSTRIRNYDWEVRNKLAQPSASNNSSRILSVNKSDIEEAGFDSEEELYYSKEVEDGKIVIDISRDRVKE